MGRKSSLSESQWAEIERRVLVDGITVNAIAQEFGVNESSIRRKIKPNKADATKPANPLIGLAKEKIAADKKSRDIAERIAELPMAKQIIVSDLARKLSSISEHMGSAAEYGAATAHRLSALANQQLQKVDDVDPMKNRAELETIAVLTKMANSSSEIGINLLRANKETIDGLNRVDQTAPVKTLADFYGESDSE